MRLPWLQADEPFPPTRLAWPGGSDAPGLLAAGGGLEAHRLVQAYRSGIFPWYSEGQPVLWWSPDPRMVLDTADFRLSRSLRRHIRAGLAEGRLEIRMDHGFRAVIEACAGTPRAGQDGTWILPEMVHAYQRLHAAGFAHSVETWWDGGLAGGLYLMNVGGMVYGESMFAWRTDASKMALAALVAFCRTHGLPWIDCQQQTRHLASLGAAPVARADFERHLAAHCDRTPPAAWRFEPAMWDRLAQGLGTGLDTDEAA